MPKDATPRPLECFASMPFSEEFDAVYLRGMCAIQQLLPQYQITVRRADKEAYHHRHLEDNVVRRIDRADVVLADITPYESSGVANVSVMHEVGYASGKQIPVILVGKKGTHKQLPANLSGSLIVEYESTSDRDLASFAQRLAAQVDETVREEVVNRLRGDYRVECFTERHKIDIPRLLRRATKRIYILTTNLEFTVSELLEAIQEALAQNDANSSFKIEILTMDPESDVANARALQLGRQVRQYRDELRDSLDKITRALGEHRHVEIVTYRTLPTQMTFIIDDVVITGIVSLGQQSREGVHFLFKHIPDLAEAFLAHFRGLKILATAK